MLGNKDEMESVVRVFKAVAHPLRLQILQLLADKGSWGVAEETCCAGSEVCVCRITAMFDVSMPTISHHLKLLKDAGLVHSRRDGVWIYYSLAPELIRRAGDFLDAVADKAAELGEV